MYDLSEIQKAIDVSNKAFEEFKSANDVKGAVASDKVAKMYAAFEDVTKGQSEIKKLVESIEAKASRPNFGQGNDTDADKKAHGEAFGKYIRKGADFDIAIEQKALGISTNAGADGGYAVPKVIDASIENLAINISPIRGLAEVVQISTSDYHKLAA